MTRAHVPVVATVAVAALASCSIPSGEITGFGAACSAANTACPNGYTCDAARAICVPSAGNSGEGEGEGEGAHVGEGEGEGAEGEGEGVPGQCAVSCDCAAGKSCIDGRCFGVAFPACNDDSQCVACDTCDQSTKQCEGAPVPGLLVTLTWDWSPHSEPSPEVSIIAAPLDSDGHYCVGESGGCATFQQRVVAEDCLDFLDCEEDDCLVSGNDWLGPTWNLDDEPVSPNNPALVPGVPVQPAVLAVAQPLANTYFFGVQYCDNGFPHALDSTATYTLHFDANGHTRSISGTLDDGYDTYAEAAIVNIDDAGPACIAEITDGGIGPCE